MSPKTSEKNYIRRFLNYLLLMIAIVLMCIFAYKLHNIYKENQLSTSVLSRVIGSIQYEDINSTMKELTSDDFIIISFVKNEETRKVEKELKETIINNNLQNNTYYLDVTDQMLEEGYLDELNSKFKLSGKEKINGLPSILYYEDGKFIEKITHKDNNKTLNELFNELITKYNIGSDRDA